MFVNISETQKKIIKFFFLITESQNCRAIRVNRSSTLLSGFCSTLLEDNKDSENWVWNDNTSVQLRNKRSLKRSGILVISAIPRKKCYTDMEANTYQKQKKKYLSKEKDEKKKHFYMRFFFYIY